MVRGGGTGQGNLSSQRVPRFHIPASGHTTYAEPEISEAGPGFKEEEKRSQNHQNNIVKCREIGKCNVADFVLGIKISELIVNRMAL